jgi:hypothetical protein
MTNYDPIAIAALAVGFCELVYAGIHAAKLKSMTKTLSTKYLGKFPDYLSEIADLLKGAKKRIDICCDFPAYGHFSNIDAFRSYEAVLAEKKGHVKITLICPKPTLRLHALRQQFENQFDTPSFQRKLGHFLRDEGKEKAEAVTLEKFVHLLEKSNVDTLRRVLLHDHDMAPSDEILHLFFWLVDERVAIFSIPSRPEKASEYGFYTSDRQLIKALKEMRGRYQGKRH